MGENIVLLVSIMPVVVIFLGIGIYSFKNNIPMHFWSGSIVEAKEITDIKAYNKAVGTMWIVYGLLYFISWIISNFSNEIGNILMGLLALPGVIVLILCYNRIYNKYKTGYKKEKTNQDKKYMWIAMGFITMPCLVFSLILATVDVTGGHELSIKDNNIKIKVTNFNIEDIESIELLDEINITGKVTGTNTLTYSRGTFDVNGQKNRVYIYNNSSPYIKFNIKDNKVVYYNEKSSDDTEKTYNKLLKYIK